MARTTTDTWNPEFLTLSPIFDSIKSVSHPFTKLGQWPTLEQFSIEFQKQNTKNKNQISVLPVAQGDTPENFEEQYESRIYLKGELQTRLENWHDLFNATAWLQFPKIKSALNSLHFENSKTRVAGTNRSPLENAIALFDECGAVIVTDDEKYLDLIRKHEWKEVFWHNKEAWGTNNSKPSIQCYVFGHAMHEKALTPYIGMTTHTIMLKRDSNFFQKSYQEQLQEIDQIISNIWLDNKIEKTKDLQPLPLLGVPEWWADNQDEVFYSNESYFRALKRKEPE